MENYEKIYGIVEYASDINEHMTILERRIGTNNPSIPMNIYRGAPGNAPEKLFPEVEQFL